MQILLWIVISIVLTGLTLAILYHRITTFIITPEATLVTLVLWLVIILVSFGILSGTEGGFVYTTQTHKTVLGSIDPEYFKVEEGIFRIFHVRIIEGEKITPFRSTGDFSFIESGDDFKIVEVKTQQACAEQTGFWRKFMLICTDTGHKTAYEIYLPLSLLPK